METIKIDEVVKKDDRYFQKVAKITNYPECLVCCREIEHIEHLCFICEPGTYFIEIPKYRGELAISIQNLKKALAERFDTLISYFDKAIEKVEKIIRKILKG